MSSTQRGAQRHNDDYYVTPHWLVQNFLKAVEYTALDEALKIEAVLDPSCGGCAQYEASYPSVLRQTYPGIDLLAIDIRDDARSDVPPVDFLGTTGCEKYGVVITNPPFNKSVEFVEKALEHVPEFGFVVVLQRLNWLGTKGRKAFWDNAPLYNVYVHSERASFYPDQPNKKDSIEYAHFVFRKGWASAARMTVI